MRRDEEERAGASADPAPVGHVGRNDHGPPTLAEYVDKTTSAGGRVGITDNRELHEIARWLVNNRGADLATLYKHETINAVGNRVSALPGGSDRKEGG